jgi:hypothetical protein
MELGMGLISIVGRISSNLSGYLGYDCRSYWIMAIERKKLIMNESITLYALQLAEALTRKELNKHTVKPDNFLDALVEIVQMQVNEIKRLQKEGGV